MQIIKFTIDGNQEDPVGNPIPYLRTTQNSQWTPKAIRYQQWKMHVVAKFIDEIERMDVKKRKEVYNYIYLGDLKPIKKFTSKVEVKLMISFKDKTHADSDNIFKGIADALFMNDKYIMGSFDYKYSNFGKVEVTIKFL